MPFVTFVLEEDEVLVAVPREVDYVWKLRHSVQQVLRRRSGAGVQLDQVTMSGGLDGGADPLLLAPDAQVPLRAGSKYQHAKLLGLRCSHLANHLPDVGSGLVDALSQDSLPCGELSRSELLIALAAPLNRLGFGLFRLGDLTLESRFLLGESAGSVMTLGCFLACGRSVPLGALGLPSLGRGGSAARGSTRCRARLGGSGTIGGLLTKLSLAGAFQCAPRDSNPEPMD